MRCPSVLLSATTAIALGYPGVAIAEEVLNPPASLQDPQIPERVFIAPEAKVIETAPTVDSSTLSVAESAIEAAPASTPVETTTSDLAVEAPRTVEASTPIVANAPASSLGTPVAVDMADKASKCPLLTEAVAMAPTQLAQASTSGVCPRPDPIAPLVLPEPFKAEASPALSIYIPVGYGLDGWSVWGSGTFQAGVREDTGSVGAGGIGVGLGDAKKAVGLELGYTFVDSEDFGEGGFSGKLHRRIGNDLSVAVGWNGFLNIERNDFEQSIYGVATKIFRLRESLDDPFSRIALTVGAGNNQFRTNYDRDEFENGTNVFGNLAFRIIRPVSLIAEWTGQDLALGLSIAPFKNIPFVITPAVRDVTGSGYEPRFVLGAGVSFKF